MKSTDFDMKEFTLKSSADGLNLAVAVSEPLQAPRAVVQIVHGMCEHKERYYAFMDWLAQRGFLCVIHDHRGHGASVKSPEDLGFMYDGGWRALVEDIKIVGDWARKEYPGLEFILFGHSMGSLAVRSYTKRYDDTIDGLFVCGSPSDNPAKGIGRLLALIAGLTNGGRKRPGLLQKMSFGAYNKPFENEGFASAWVCSDKSVLEAYHKDPLCQFVFTANGFANLLGLMQDCYSSKGWRLANPSLPVHFISGAEDPCRTSDDDFLKAVENMRSAGYRSVDCKLYPGMRHEILNETDHIAVWNDILNQI